jgi:hypothetical protein
MQNRSKARWFWAWLVEMTLPKSSWNEPTGRGELWRNLIIVRATSAREAVSKALRLGAAAEGDCRGTLRINGEPGLTKFLGVEAMGLVHENLDDGSEILWQLRKCQQETARRLVKDRAALISSIESELESEEPISDVGGRAVKRFIRAELLRLKRKRAVSPGVPHKR